ncbi:S41 family peptidase, partial [Hellea sp.]|nr:S41 family peptidase [Hellea sp.]
MTKLSSRLLTTVALAIMGTALVACGGGGSSSSSPSPVAAVVPPPPPPPPPVSQAPTFTANEFEPRENFVAQCEVPRSGRDPDGNTFPDSAGSTLIEKFWLRSWSDETYLWNDEIQDRDPNSIADRVDYFDVLVTNELSETGSGREKDDFHFSESTEDFFDRRNSTATSGYGLRLAFIQSAAPNREIRVLYTEPNSPASAVQNGEVNFQRGALLIEIDGEDVLNGNDVDTLNAGLFPANAGESHTFTVRDPGSTADRTFTIRSQDIAPSPVNRTEIIDTPTGKVGYVLFNTFSPFESENSLNEAFTQLESEDIDDLVLDLRYNGGGLVAVAAQLGFMIAGPSRTRGRTASLLQYNDAAGNTNPVTGQVVDPIPFLDEGVGFSVSQGTDLATVDLPRVYILTTGGTCSASELVINSLRGIDYEVVIIGDTTCGKPYGFLPTDNCGRTYYTIQFRSLNDKGFGDYSDGFSPQDTTSVFSEKSPGCTIADNVSGTSAELGDPNEALLSAALAYRENGMCPVVTSKSENWTAAKARNDVLGTGGLQVNDELSETLGSFLDA